MVGYFVGFELITKSLNDANAHESLNCFAQRSKLDTGENFSLYETENYHTPYNIPRARL